MNMIVKTPLEILRLTLGISGAIAGVNIIVEQLFKSTIFTVFLNAIPAYLRVSFPSDELITWFTIRANRNLYTSWDIALIYFVLTSITFALFIGCWAFLVLTVTGVYNIGVTWLIVWFIFVIIDYMAVSNRPIRLRNKTT
jgi:hypothetical protein